VRQDQQPRALTIRDVLVGDVWLLAGGGELWKRKADGQIGTARARVFSVSVGTAPDVKKDVRGRWEVVASSSLKRLPAQACFLGQSLASRNGVPV
ncbi:MAG: hypothetical protein QF473_25575, partial [Planctomycetota bacterium]|nr:hypothetical protein [Planctomycetota bacterium]